MKRVLCCGILAASVVAGYIHWRGNHQVYSLNIYAGGWSYSPEWNVGPLKFSERTDVGFPGDWGKKRETPTFTDIQFGSHRMTIKGDVSGWISKLEYTGVMLGIGLFFFIVTTPRGWEKKLK